MAISSEIYFDFPWLIPTQYEWLENDLKVANANRSNAPWVIAYHHRPLYCTGILSILPKFLRNHYQS